MHEEISWAETAMTPKVFGFDVWVLIPLLPGMLLWHPLLIKLGFLGFLFFAILSFFGYSVPKFFRVFRRFFAGPLKTKPLGYLSKSRFVRRNYYKLDEE